MIKRSILAALLITQVLQGQEITTLTLEQCFQKACSNSPYAKDRDRIVRTGELKNSSTKSQWYPQLNVSGQATYQSDAIDISLPLPTGAKHITTSKDQYKMTLDVNQVLYDGGAVKAQRQISAMMTEADLKQVDIEIQKTKEQVGQVYFNLLLVKKNKAILESTMQLLYERGKSIKAAVENGLLQQNEADVLEVELMKVSQNIKELDLIYLAGLRNLSELTADSLKANVLLALPEILINPRDSITRQELFLFSLQKQGLDYSERMASSQRMPKLVSFAQAGYGRPGLNMLQDEFQPFYYVGVSVKWTIWDWNKTSHDRQLLGIQKDMIDTRKEVFLRSIRIGLNNSAARIEQLEQSLATDTAIVEKRNDIALRSAKRLDNGIISASDYITDLNASAQAKLQLEMHSIQLVQEKVNYSLLLGKL